MSLIIPISNASSKENVFPVTISSMALLFPTKRRQALRTAGTRQHAQIHLGQANLARILARNADIGRHSNLQAHRPRNGR